MSTRFRAIVISTVTAIIFFLAVLGVLNFSSVAAQFGGVDHLATNVVSALIISVTLLLGTMWVLFLKGKNYSLIILGLFPSVAIFPYMLLADSIVSSVFNDLGKVSVAIIATGVYWLVCYLLILTANVLNGSILFNIPLGQAGKASQFIFSLISSYFLIAFLFGAAFPIPVRVIVVAIFVFYFSFASIFALQVSWRQVLGSSTAITLVMLVVTILLSIWPISSVYATLAAVVLLYIMLNVALEMREKIGNAIWIEYSVLVLLVVIILFTNAQWGINGSII